MNSLRTSCKLCSQRPEPTLVCCSVLCRSFGWPAWHTGCLAEGVSRNAFTIPKQRRSTNNSPRGFTLIEVLATVMIISILSALALPALRDGMKDRRTWQTAQEVARIYREARLRAVGRGSAVLVRYRQVDNSFTIREAVLGPSPGGASAPCNRLPATSCLQANWASTANASTTLGSQALHSFTYEENPASTGLHVALEVPNGSATKSVSDFSVCFTPLGRAYTAEGGDLTATTASVMTFAPTFRVYRTTPGTTNLIGLERRVVLLPNGQARLHTAKGSTP